MSKKKVIFILILLVGALLSSGCVDGQVDIKVNGDGSGDLSYAMVIDKRNYDPELLEEYIKKLEENLFTVKQRDMGEIIIVNASVYLPKFRTIFDPTSILGNEEGKIPVEFSKNWLSTEYVFDFEYDVDKVKEFIAQELSLDEVSFNTMSFSVRLPNEAEENNADEIDNSDNMYSWKINKSGITRVYLETKTINKISMIVTIGIPILAGIALFKERKNIFKKKTK
jgi:hypothetical protein